MTNLNQLQAVQHETGNVNAEIQKVWQKLATVEQAGVRDCVERNETAWWSCTEKHEMILQILPACSRFSSAFSTSQTPPGSPQTEAGEGIYNH